MRTSFPEETAENASERTNSAQNPADSGREKTVRFPKVILNKKSKQQAVIYGKSEGGELKKDGTKTEPYPFYRVAWRKDGKRLMQSFARYSDALKAANEKVRQLSGGSDLPSLSEGQARDAKNAFARLREFRIETGQNLKLEETVLAFISAAKNLPKDRTLDEAAKTFASTLVAVQRTDLSVAVEKFISDLEPRTKASKPGERPALDKKYFYNLSIMLRRFSAMYPNIAVSELSKKNLDDWISKLGKSVSKKNEKPAGATPKSRNHHRAIVRQFLQWCMRKDFLPQGSRLLEADGLRPERADTSKNDYYSVEDFAKLLERSEGPMRAMIALCGLAGLRTAEALRLTWEDCFRVEGHIEITSSKSKTRQRRLVEVCPSLAQWLAPYKGFSGKIWPQSEAYFQEKFALLCEAKPKVFRIQNGLRHAFCTYHFAIHGENATAIQAGNSPQQIHKAYKGLCVKKCAEAFFAITPKAPENVVQMPAAEAQASA